MEEIVQLWDNLVKSTEKKSLKLQEALQQQQFNRGIEDLELWVSEIEGQMVSVNDARLSDFYILMEKQLTDI